MTGFEITNKAKSDLKEIGLYTQNTWGKKQRDIYLTTLDKSFHTLAANPLKGRDCGEIRSGYRKHQVGKHIIPIPISFLFKTLIPAFSRWRRSNMRTYWDWYYFLS